MKPQDIRPQARNPERFSKAHEFDADEDGFDAVHDLFDDLRARCPVAHSNDIGGFWLFTRYADVAEAISDSATYATAVQNVVPKVATTGRRPPLHLDPPEHTPYRRALTPLFRRDRIAHWTPIIRTIASDLFAPLAARGHADICQDYGYPLPALVLARFFGIAEDDAERIRDQGQDFNLALGTQDRAAMERTSLVLYESAARMIADRRANPRDPKDDPVTALLAAEHDGAPLPDDMILGTVRQLLMVGIVAPTTFLGSVALHFARNPTDFDELRNDRSLVPAAAEELLRLYTPYRGFARTPTRDIEVGGRLIRQDEPIALAFAAANRDPAVYSEPDRYKLDRAGEPPHLAFGRGPHHCAGQGIAMLMLTASLEAFAEHAAGFEVAGDIVMTKWPEYGPLRLPVRIIPA